MPYSFYFNDEVLEDFKFSIFERRVLKFLKMARMNENLVKLSTFGSFYTNSFSTNSFG